MFFPSGMVDAKDNYISFSNSISFNYYDVTGDSVNSPYQFEGVQPYNQFNLSFNNQDNPSDIWKGQLAGLLNYSDYQNNENGFVLNNFALSREKGDVSLPFRVEIGDIYTFLSYRTIQQSLKGVQIEFQPRLSLRNFNSSLLFFSGAKQSNWSHLAWDKNHSSGFSWLLETPELGCYGLNLVYNSRSASVEEGTLDRQQYVIGLAGENTFNLLNQNITLEGEINHFSGDHNGIDGQNKNDQGIFLQFKGNNVRLPLSYRLRFERYGKHYQPQGAVIDPDRYSREGHLSWDLASGLRLGTRIQDICDNWEGDNPLNIRTYGLSISGSKLNLDTFLREQKNEDLTTDQITKNIKVGFNLPLKDGWDAQIVPSYQEKIVSGEIDTITNQIRFNATHELELNGFVGSISPGFMFWRVKDGSNNCLNTNPTLALNLRREGHSVDYSLWLNAQEEDDPAGSDVQTLSSNLIYQYQWGQNTLKLGYTTDHHNSQDNEQTNSQRVSVFYNYSFDGPGLNN